MDDLKFRYQQNDGRNVAVVAVAATLVVPVVAAVMGAGALAFTLGGAVVGGLIVYFACR